jgi:hypothetical protein
LLAAYAACPAGATSPKTLDRFTRRASSLARSSGRKARVMRTTPQKLMPNSHSKSGVAHLLERAAEARRRRC